MNKLFLILTLGITLIGCNKRDYSCECVVNGGEYKTIISHTTRSDASKQCTDKAKAVGQKQGSYSYECTVK